MKAVRVTAAKRALIILFSYNRAMQADATLRSIEEHLAGGDVEIAIVWRADVDHRESYALLREKHELHGVTFYEELAGLAPWLPVLPALLHARNLRQWQRHAYLRKLTGFKPLVEGILSRTGCSLVSFQTDDCIYYRDEPLPEAALRRIAAAPADCSYRVYVGANYSQCPEGLGVADDLLAWNYYDQTMYHHWAYPFAVDGTFYNVAFLRRFLSFLYHNPVSLESGGVGSARRKRILSNGLSPRTSSLLDFPINKVDFMVPGNAHGGASLERLRDAFVEGYSLQYDVPVVVTASGRVPERFWLCRGPERLEVRVT